MDVFKEIFKTRGRLNRSLHQNAPPEVWKAALPFLLNFCYNPPRMNADINAALNIARRGAVVIQPNAVA